MTVDAFVDTNVLLYSVSGNAREADKREAARRLLAGTAWGPSAPTMKSPGS
jgi:predicted nucleic acid-binding protein